MKKNPSSNAQSQSRRRAPRKAPRKGIALITVLALLAITTLLIAAFFSLAKVELVSSDTYANGIRSRQLADTAVNIAMSQLRKATVPPTGSNSIYYAWASQPGAIRKYDRNGNFYEAHKLYSDSNMVVDRNEGEETLVNDSPPGNWDDQPERYVDLNAPVIRRSSNGELDERFFPILDPRAAMDFGGGSGREPLKPIAGFSYTDTYFNGTKDDKVIQPTGSGDFKNADPHIPMPVEWLYVLEDGTMGYLNDQDIFEGTSPDGSPVSATPENPMVGRIAFWTDDESSKINVNTASEPTFWNVPWLYSEFDRFFAEYQPGRREFQRYPGHPATTALSPVLFPGLYDGIDMRTDPITVAQKLRDRKELIFDMVPRIGVGGSRSGTLKISENTSFLASDQNVKPVELDGDRLYATLDELVFQSPDQAGSTTGDRQENPLLDSRALQRAQFFLTAKSRAPETTMFNTPRISMWPVHRRAVKGQPNYDAAFGTGFDNLISFCSTANGIPYFFMRENADVSFATTGAGDLGGRNRRMGDNWKLFNASYLWDLVDQPVPGYGKSFTDKYGDDEAHQIMTEIFDYIRATNLYDDLLVPDRGFRPEPDPLGRVNANGDPVNATPYRPKDGVEFFTYTDPRDSSPVRRVGYNDENFRIFPGHGQVVPIEVQNRSGGRSRGLGRFFTVSEATLHFICNADGNQFALGHPGGGLTYSRQIVPDPSPGNLIREHLRTFAIGNEDGGLISQFGGAAGRTYDRGGGPLRDDSQQTYYPPSAPDNKFWYSGFPPLPANLIPTPEQTQAKIANPDSVDSSQFAYQTANYEYPGYDRRNWNYNLAAPWIVNAGNLQQVLLKENERLVQCMFHVETFCPSLGNTPISPEMHIEVDGLDTFTLEGHQLFPTQVGGYVLTPGSGSILDGSGQGGSSGVRGFYRNKDLPTRKRIDETFTYPGIRTLPEPDNEWQRNGAGSQGVRDWIVNPCISDIIKVKGPAGDPEASTMTFNGGRITLTVKTGKSRMWADELKQTVEAIQTIEIDIPNATFVTPQLVLYGTRRRVNGQTGVMHAYSSGPPFWWTFNRNGCYGLTGNGAVNNNNKGSDSTGVLEAGQPSRITKPDPQLPRRAGRVLINNTGAGVMDVDSIGRVSERDDVRSSNFFRREDTIQSVLPWHGDYRHVLLAKQIRASDGLFLPHSDYGSEQHAHNLYSNSRTDRIPDFSFPKITMLAGIGKGGFAYRRTKWPDFPDTRRARQAQLYVALYKDFDQGVGNNQDGPYINKPDEGDTRIFRDEGYYDEANQWRVSMPYLVGNGENAEAAGPSYFSPNRQIPSPGMFGSLPSGVKGTPGYRGGRAEPWRTLLFRPPSGSLRHPGERNQPNQGDIPDHLWMDFFWMPVVEPYAISEPFSTAGKINLNYQILPFTNIQRATGIHALLEGEKVLCYPSTDTYDALDRPGTGAGSTGAERWWDNSQKKWWRDINVEETLRQFRDPQQRQGKFDKGELFRSASEICEVNMVPEDKANPATLSYHSPTKLYRMVESGSEFYTNTYKPTGDNSRERPYTNVYPRVTTKSNTFQVHYRTQAIQKSTLTDPQKFTPGRDSLTSEFRGSTIVERYIDPNDPEIPDYRRFTSDNPAPLDKFYRYRIVSTKRFSP